MGRFLQGYFWNGEWMIPLYLLVLGVLAAVWSGSYEAALILPPLAFGLGGVAEAFVPGASAAETRKRIVKLATTGSAV